VNGNGCADLVYVDFDRVYFWFNQSGNRWSEENVIAGTPRVSDVDSIQFADIFGTGTATLLWSYDFNGQPGGNYKALDFCGGNKPYVLTEMSNNRGGDHAGELRTLDQVLHRGSGQRHSVGHQAALSGTGGR
jgi:hypothetical protein